MIKKIWFLLSIALIIGFTANAEEKSRKFESSLSLGITYTDGNSENLLFNAALTTEGEREGLGSIKAGIEGNYGNSRVDEEKETTVKNAKAFLDAKKTISPKTYGGLDLTALYDDIAEIDYRLIIAPNLGMYAVKSDKLALCFEVGPAYVFEKLDGEDADYFALRLAEECKFQISETAKAWQSAEYLSKADDFDKYLINAELGVEAALNSRLNLRVTLKNRYDNEPSDEKERNDFQLIAGINIAL
ncbi:MAG: DUF481 domain-containing protein [Lentisphaerae bacterium]|jgi:putative salt-induced outer membrane protein YdiY|nr:DUF481 domain-containing protein [Lentisphaerota bacterium]